MSERQRRKEPCKVTPLDRHAAVPNLLAPPRPASLQSPKDLHAPIARRIASPSKSKREASAGTALGEERREK
jgi:hypothetical protein